MVCQEGAGGWGYTITESPAESPATESPADGIPDGLPAELTLEGLLAMSPVVHGMARGCWVGGILTQNPH